jgi:hypothetical protein
VCETAGCEHHMVLTILRQQAGAAVGVKQSLELSCAFYRWQDRIMVRFFPSSIS